MTALGVGTGCLVHVTAAAGGLSALIAASDVAISVMKWLGAAYLVWLGIGLLRDKAAAGAGVAGLILFARTALASKR